MATVYKAEITSHWISYSKEELEEIVTEAVKKIERKKGNTIQIRVEEIGTGSNPVLTTKNKNN